MNYKITDGLNPVIQAAVKTINKYCQYDTIWYYHSDGTISKDIDKVSAEDTSDRVPTSFQISEISKYYCESATPHESSMFAAYLTLMGFWYPTAEFYELSLICLAKLAEDFQEYIAENEEQEYPKEDPFVNS